LCDSCLAVGHDGVRERDSGIVGNQAETRDRFFSASGPFPRTTVNHTTQLTKRLDLPLRDRSSALPSVSPPECSRHQTKHELNSTLTNATTSTQPSSRHPSPRVARFDYHPGQWTNTVQRNPRQCFAADSFVLSFY